jgi:hypothetical protein
MTEVMPEVNKEDLLIRRILIATATMAVGGFLMTIVVVAVMVSSNFNFMNWLE